MVRIKQTLSEMSDGQTATIRDIDSASPIASRLFDLGFIPGTKVQVVRRAPLGDPVMFRVRGYQIGLRLSEARWIDVDTDLLDVL